MAARGVWWDDDAGTALGRFSWCWSPHSGCAFCRACCWCSINPYYVAWTPLLSPRSYWLRGDSDATQSPCSCTFVQVVLWCVERGAAQWAWWVADGKRAGSWARPAQGRGRPMASVLWVGHSRFFSVYHVPWLPVLSVLSSLPRPTAVTLRVRVSPCT